MAQFDPPVSLPPAEGSPPQGAITLAHVIYGLYLFGCLSTMTWWLPIASLITLSFLVGIVLAHVRQADARGTWLASHYRWQIRTFWFGLVWTLVAWILIATIIGALIGGPMLLALTVWLIYRVLRGWLLLNDGKAVPNM